MHTPIQLSSRFDWSRKPNALSRAITAKRASGNRLLDLTTSNPTACGFAYPAADLRSALAAADCATYHPNAKGSPAALDAVCRYYAQRGSDLDPSRLLLTASTSEAYSFLFKLLCDPGDCVLAPRPSYPMLDLLARLESVELRHYPLRYDGAWHLDLPALEAALTPRTRAIVVVHPNNPTGSMLTVEEWARLQQLAARHGCTVISDEVFTAYPFEDSLPGIATAPLALDAQVLTFSLNGLSKLAGLPQMKLGWILAGGPDCAPALSALELIADTFLSVSAPVQAALPALLNLAPAISTTIRERVLANRAFLCQTTLGSAISLLTAHAGWTAVLQVPTTKTDEEWALTLLEEHNVIVQPGFFYDFETEAFLVVSLLTPPEILEEGMRRIGHAIDA